MNEKKEFINKTVHVLLGFFLILLIKSLLNIFYTFDEKSMQKLVEEALNVKWSRFWPEPVERYTYMLSMVSIPLILLGLYPKIRKIINNLNDLKLKRAYQGSLFFLIVIPLLSLFLNINRHGLTPVHLKTFYFSVHGGIFTFLILPLICCLTFWRRARQSLLGKKLLGIEKKVNSSKVFWIFSLITLFIIFSMNLFNYSFYPGLGFHLNPVLWPISQVLMGKTLTVDFFSFYGLYPHFFEIPFSITQFSVLKYSVMMQSLLAFSFLLILLFLNRVIKNNLIKLFTFISFAFYNYLYLRVVLDGEFSHPYHQYYPVRLLFPALGIYLISKYIYSPNKKNYILPFVFLPIGIFWNSDTGLIIFLTWPILLVFKELAQRKEKMIQNIMKHTLATMLSFGIALGSFVLFIYLRSGELPDFAGYFDFTKVFYVWGFFMIPMHKGHPWFLLIIAYMIGIFYGIRAIWKKEYDKESSIYFFLSILGVGIFSYYQGRSHDYNLLNIGFPALFILAIMMDRLNQKKEMFLPSKYFYVVGLFLIISPAQSLLFHMPTITKYVKRGLSSFSHYENKHLEQLNFIKENTKKDKVAFIEAPNIESVYYAMSGIASPIHTPCSTHMFIRRDIKVKSDFLRDNNTFKVFWPGDRGFPKNYKIVKKSETGKMLLLAPL
jgi:hypothetical protein